MMGLYSKRGKVGAEVGGGGGGSGEWVGGFDFRG
jgi:hypothetical protein